MRKMARIITSSALVAALAVVGTATTASAATTVRDITTFACRPDAVSPFTDVAGSAHEGAIACIVGYGLASGTTASTYAPSRSVTRGQMATFLANFIDLVGLPLGPPPEDPGTPMGPRVYSDVSGNTHEDNIYYLTDLGIAQGTSATTFSPGAPVTRGQMATFLVRTMEFLGYPMPLDPPDAFADDAGGAHEASANAIAVLGLAQGTGPSTYEPGHDVTRGAMATFLARMLDLGIEAGFAQPTITSEAVAAMDGAAVSPGPGSSATGVAFVATTDVDGVVCFQVDGIAGATAIHVHQGAAGSNGPVVATIPLPEGALATGCTTAPGAAALAADPDGHYVDVHTAEKPDGAIRGQLGTIETSASSDLRPEQVVPGPGSADAFGFATVYTTSQPNVLCVSAVALTSGDAITALHLHQGALHTNGALVLDVTTDPGSAEMFVLRCASNPMAETIASTPGGFYVDAHTTAFPDGAVRGQLSADL
jgi:hypothetical protein